MRKLLLFLSLISLSAYSQIPSCPDTAIYFQNGNNIYKFYPEQPFTASNPALFLSSVPGQGLAVSNNLNSTSGPNPTFYTTVSGLYYYWNGASWTNTNHSTGATVAVNPAGGGCYIYNLVGSTGDIYKYSGTGNATLVTTVSGFAGGGPYDLACDVDGSFYVLKTQTPQLMYHYDQTGSLLTTYTMSGMPPTTAGGGYSVFGNKIWVCNSNGFFKGTISVGSISFSLVPSTPTLVLGASDFGNCATMSTGFLNYAFTNSGPVGCANNTSTLIAGGWPSSTTYSWSGPSISGSTTSQTAIATAPGVYNCTVTAPGNCPTIMSTSVASSGSVTITTNTLSSPICQGSSATFTAGGATNYTWTPSSSLSSSSASLVIASPTANTTYTVTGSTGTCVSNPVALTVTVMVCSNVQELGSVIDLQVYPNPNNGELYIKGKESGNFKLINELGQEARKISIGLSNGYHCEIKNLDEGVYFLIDTESGRALRTKIIVIRQ